MVRCNRCKRDPCGCSSSTSSSTSSSSSSSSSSIRRDAYNDGREDNCVDLCDGVVRLKECSQDRVVRSLKSFAVDTYNIIWRRRVLQVPSREYPTIDDALASLQINAGGYVIKLAEGGNYTIHARLCRTVDDLTIEGDCDPFAGLTYSRRCVTDEDRNLPPPVEQFPLCRTRTDSITGSGPFELVVNGSSITVYGLSNRGDRDSRGDPCFTSMRERRVILFSATGLLVEGKATGLGNTITVNVPIPFTDIDDSPTRPGTYDVYRRRCSGFGFFFPPSVTLTGSIESISLVALNSIKIVGCQISLPKIFFFGAKNGAASLANCWVSDNVAFFGQVFCEDPNVWTGLCYCLPATSGTLNFQSFVSPLAHLTVDASMMSVNYSLFASTIHAIDCTNGGTLHLLGCEVVNNCLALSAYQGATVAIPDTRFCCNLYTLYAAYQSRITSNPVNVPGIDTTRTYSSPWLIHNVIMFIASMESFIIVPNLRAVDNLIPGLLDGNVHTTLESIHIDIIAQKGSTIVFLPSASTPTPVGLGCVNAGSLPGSIAQGYLINLLRANSWNVTSPSFIASLVGETDVSITASESLNALASRMATDDVNNMTIPF